MSFRKILIFLPFLAMMSVPAAADQPLGLWQTTPDNTGMIAHVRTRACGSAYCGRVERAKDRRGYDTPSNAVGSKMLWDMIPQDDGSYLGQVWEPRVGRMQTTTVRVEGNQMLLQRCEGGECRNETWSRLR